MFSCLDSLSGSGVGYPYDEQRNTLWLPDQAVSTVAPDAGQGGMDVTAGAFGFVRADRYMRFERAMHMVRDGQVIDANEATVHLFADRDEPDLMELRGDARIAGGASLGAFRALWARDINLDYRDDGRTLQQATLAGKADVQLAGQGSAIGQRLSGDWMDVSLADDGSVKSLASRDNVQVTLPATRDTAARTIRSTALTASGGTGGLSAMQFQEGVEYREAASTTQGARTARARALADVYFGRIKAHPRGQPPVRTREVVQEAEKRMIAYADTNPEVEIRVPPTRLGASRQPAQRFTHKLCMGRFGRAAPNRPTPGGTASQQVRLAFH